MIRVTRRKPRFGLWTKIEDKLPELGTTVLVRICFTDEDPSSHFVKINRADQYSDYRFWYGFDQTWYRKNVVTHWMPLPDIEVEEI